MPVAPVVAKYDEVKQLALWAAIAPAVASESYINPRISSQPIMWDLGYLLIPFSEWYCLWVLWGVSSP